MNDEIQLDLFGTQAEVEPLSRIKRYGEMDARCGLPLRGEESYADRITGEAQAVYEAAFREERARMLSDVLAAKASP